MNLKFLKPVVCTLLVIGLSGCGNYTVPEESDEIPTMTEARGFSYLETETERTPTVTEKKSETTLPDMTGTDLATTYTDEFGNIYGVSETEPVEINSDNTSPYPDTTVFSDEFGINSENFPDVKIDDYYRNTDPQNTEREYNFITSTETTAYSYTVPSVTSPITSRTEITTTSETISATTSETESETTTVTETTQSLTEDLVKSRREVIPSKYTSHNEVMHTNSYNFLTDRQKYAYDAITAAALNYEDSVSFEISDKITFDDLYTAYQTLYLDEVRLFYADTEIVYNLDYSTDYVTEMDISYIYTKSQVEEMQRKIDERTDGILSKITPQMTDYDIVKYLHDEIITNCTYTLEGNTNNITSIYGVLADNRAQCQGYARTFSYLCNLCGIETDIALGVANEDHMWNMVKIDGKWYHIDLTWDDPDKDEFPDFVRYDYFCVSTDRILELRTIEGNSHELPAADSDDLEYYNYNGLVAESLDDAREIFRREALAISKTRSSTLQFRCATSEVYEEVLSEFFDNGSEKNVIYMTDMINDDPEIANRFDSNTVYHQGNYDTMIIKIFFNYEDTGEFSSVDENEDGEVSEAS